MLFLALNIILLSGFGLFLKHAKDNQQRLNPIGFINYLCAFFISIWVLSQEQDFEFSKLTFALGISNGVTYAAGFELFTLGIRLSGIVVTAALVRLSIVIPIVVSMLFWKEIPNLWQTIGLLLTFVAIPLLSQREKEPTYKFTPDRPAVGQGLGFAVALTILVITGISRLTMKAFNEMCPIDEKSLYMSLLFGVATVIYLGVCLYQRTWPNWWEVAYGTLIGVCNVGGSWALLIALDHVSALIAFPMSSSGGVLFTMFVGMVFLHERLSRTSLIGALFAAIALIFVNLKP
ncbi:hypothetical protein C6496_10445 [Candidatus Poribacteria bacterium]|nr:MAG: hypothetical protein C6496_10445 [Candidatus Poribacteria bacterium]